jgi:hypothetical protein
MKTIAAVCGMVFIIVVLAGVCGFADDKEKFGFYVPSPSEELYGIWVNMDYGKTKSDWPQKIIIYDWGYAEGYLKVTDKDPCIKWAGWPGIPCKWTYTIVDKWTDSEGNIWYREFTRQIKQQ